MDETKAQTSLGLQTCPKPVWDCRQVEETMEETMALQGLRNLLEGARTSGPPELRHQEGRQLDEVQQLRP